MYLTKYKKEGLMKELLYKIVFKNALIISLIQLGKNNINISNEQLINLIENGHSSFDIDIVDDNLNTPLMFACQEGHYNIADILIRFKADVNRDNIVNNRPLFFACSNNNYQMAKLLLDTSKVQMNHRNKNGDTELAVASVNDNPQLIELLIEHQSDVNYMNNKGHYPIHIATINNKLNTLKTLYQHGSDIHSDNIIGNQCFALACINSYVEIMDYLLTLNADYNHTNYNGDSALHQCCILQKQDMINYILALENVNIDIPNSFGFTPFLIACKKNNLDMIKSFLNHKKVSEINIDIKSNSGDFPLFYATHYKNLELIEILLEQNADMYNEKDTDKLNCYTSFFMACSYFGSVEVLQLFLDHGVDVNRANSVGLYPLGIACKSENIEHVKLLLEHGANPNVRYKSSTPLVHTCIDNNFDIAKELIAYGADINLETSEGIHPLLFLMNECFKNNNAFIQYLIDHDADLYCKDNYGNSLLYVLKNSNKVDKEEVYDTLVSAYKRRNDFRDRCLDTTSFIETFDIYKKVIYLLKQEKEQGKEIMVLKEAIKEKENNACSTIHEVHDIFSNQNIEIDTDTLSSTQTNENSNDTDCIIIDSPSVNEEWANKEIHYVTQEEIDRAFLQAVIFGKIEEVQNLLDRFPSINVDVRETNGDTPLIIACQTGVSEIAQLLLRYHADPNLICECGNTALYVATFSYSRHHSLELIQSLLDYGANPNILSQYCLTPLMVACKDQLTEVAKILLNNKADPNMQDNSGNSAISFSCNCNDIDNISKLLNTESTNINITTKNKYTPLMITCNKRSIYTARELLKYDPNIYIKNSYGQTAVHLSCSHYINDIFNDLSNHPKKIDLLMKDNYGFSPYEIMKLNGSVSFFELLINYEIDYLKTVIECYQCSSKEELPESSENYLGDAYDTFDPSQPSHAETLASLQKKWDYIQEEKRNLEWYQSFKRSYIKNNLNLDWWELSQEELDRLVIYSCLFLDVKIIYQLVSLCQLAQESKLNIQININAKDQDGNTALHYICSNERYHRDIIITLEKLLLDQPSIDKNVQNNNGYTPLMLACYHSNESIARILLDYGVDVNLKTYQQNQTALMFACNSRSVYIARKIIEHHAEVDVQDHIDGNTALTIVSKFSQSYNLLTLLVEKGGANVNIATKKGETALLLACQANNIEHVKLLVEHGAEINVKANIPDPYQTPLLAVISNFNHYLIKYLIDHGADINSTNDRGETPLIVSCHLYNKYGSELLIKEHADITIHDNQGETAKSIIDKNQFNYILGL
ncbi:hypothetical protein BCR36DRAFT_579792 [Piromyces finnis]|uniref:Uncharacterized protein n=1 Tax=Piromyces finnis TaxID=1754191 RepID=A0A1Y1VL23_9FUNG|nr:hypothetical protein BCR36DRAFT_579792 [Piromyces finnis]|eukprot:ORX59167.1 hypothetical protein BCR36DRAFT_579792 [Piromyces finnis]